MVKSKVTITLDRAKADEARALVGASSTSEVIDIALDNLMHAERLRSDVAICRKIPSTQIEIDLALLADTGGIADDTDWSALYENGTS